MAAVQVCASTPRWFRPILGPHSAVPYSTTTSTGGQHICVRHIAHMPITPLSTVIGQYRVPTGGERLVGNEQPGMRERERGGEKWPSRGDSGEIRLRWVSGDSSSVGNCVTALHSSQSGWPAASSRLPSVRRRVSMLWVYNYVIWITFTFRIRL